MSEQGTVPGRRPPAPGEVVVLQSTEDAVEGSQAGDVSTGEPAALAFSRPDAVAVRPRSVLEEERDFFLRSLRDLEVEHDAGDIDDADYAALKDDYTVRAATVIRQLSGRSPAGSESAADVGSGPSVGDSDAPGSEGRSEPDTVAGRGFLTSSGSVSPSRSAPGRRRTRWPRWWRWTTGVVVAVAAGSLAGLAVHRGSDTRLPGQTVSGAPVGAAKDALLLAQAQKAAAAGDAVTALKDCRIILADNPNQAQALAEEGWVLAQTHQRGLETQGLGDLTHAVDLAPTDQVAHLYRGIVLLDVGRNAEAVTDLRWYLDHKPDPQVKGRVEAALVQARAGSATPTPTPLPMPPPP